VRLPYKATFLNLFALQGGYDLLTSANYFTLQLLLRNVVISEIEMAACFRGIELLTFCSDELLALFDFLWVCVLYSSLITKCLPISYKFASSHHSSVTSYSKFDIVHVTA
jgi:hypothetical protein